MDLIIGRDANTAQLKVVNGTQVTLIGNPASVPMDVSRQHCKLEVIDKDTFVITNIKAANVTWVNGIQVQSKQITLADKVQLGANKYDLPLAQIVNKVVPSIVDITHLKAVLEDYEQTNLKYTIDERKFGAARSAVGIVSMLAIACGFIFGHGPFYLLIYGTAIALSIAFCVRQWLNAKKVPMLRRDLDKKFKREYVCPKCHYFFGFKTDYDDIIQYQKCPKCKTQFKV